MNNKRPPLDLETLLKAARQAPPVEASQPPPGFATRVAARALAARQPAGLRPLFEQAWLRALTVSCLMMALTIASSYGLSRAGSATPNEAEDELLDPVTEILELSS